MNEKIIYIKNNLDHYKYLMLSVILLLVISFVINDVYHIKQSQEAIGIQKTDADYLNDDNWQLTFSDEFNGAAGEPDTSKWSLINFNKNYDYNNSRIDPADYWLYNRKPSPSTHSDAWWLPQNATLDGSGNAVIKFTRENDVDGDNNPGVDYDYATAVMTTKKNSNRPQHQGFYQKYGKFEAEFELNSKKAWWPAFWLMPDHRCVENGDTCNIVDVPGNYANGMVDGTNSNGARGSEIDIMERFGLDPLTHTTIHTNGYSAPNHKKFFAANCLEGDNSQYCKDHPSINKLPPNFFRTPTHKYTLIWTPEEYRFYIDDKIIWTTTEGVSHVPQYILLSAETDPDYDPSWIGDPNTVTPAGVGTLDEFKVNYVRVYKYTPKAPTLTDINIKQGSINGGTDVVLTGTNFNQIDMVNNSNDPMNPNVAKTKLTIDGVETTQYEILSDTSIKLTMPAHAIGSVDIDLSINGQTAKLANAYTYKNNVTTTTPNKPTALKVKTDKNKNKALIEWNGDADNYEYRYRIKGTATWIVTKTTEQKQILIENLDSSKEYEFAVRAVKSNLKSDWQSTVIILSEAEIGNLLLPNTGISQKIKMSIIGISSIAIIGLISFQIYKRAN